ncbi:hypothetical protein HMPREF1544_00333 [Mucor circinelloides 1006PhL]|uniref:Uncharacterized protein n=1 Tax=Mucor circinelloides f. circinelloides (strain 1006PhL) TaxID=1220926 RepID=S2JSJ0_MUCC1|nr:hypothetical protein HMPREF1544_00333 [Mucor circinelloides 1006PhL]
MGAQTSKVARKLPTKARPETLHNIPNESPSTLGSMANAASEIKTDFIEQESRDPQLHENLKSLGPVTIAPTITKMKPSDTMLKIMKQRKEAEEKELRGHAVTEENMSIDSLFTLLEQRKRLQPGEIDKPEIRQALLQKYKIDEPTLSTLLKYYNTMAIMPPAIDDKEERRMSVWVTDKVDWENQVRMVDRRNQEIKKARQEALKDNNRAKKEKEDSKEDQALKDLFDESY